MQLTPGSVLGPYEIVSLLGAGGMGEVYEATDRRLGRRVAVKILTARSVARSEALERFQREARAVAALSHPNVVTLFDIGEEGDHHYVVTELLEGETLRARLERAISPADAVAVATAVCDGLGAAHEKRIVHRDLKPENIFLTETGGVKILDFGLARLDELLGSDSDSTATLMKTPGGVVLGTVAYMSPEQVRADPAEATTDVFAIGCILYEMTTGTRPFDRPTAAETMHAILKEPVPPLPGRKSKFLKNLEALIHDCLEKEPARRPSTAREIAERLRGLESAAPAARPLSPRAAKGTVVAVLHFTARDASDTGVAELLSDEIRNRLSGHAKIRVIARSALQRYRDTEVDPRDAGRTLKATAVLSGEVRRIGPSLHLQAELLDVADGSQMWGDRFVIRDSDGATIEGVVSEIAREITPRFSAESKSRPRRHKSGTSSESLQLVSAARAQIDAGTPDSIRRAVTLLKEARSQEDSPLACALSAEAAVARCRQSLESPIEMRDLAIDAAERAISGDPDSVDCVAALAAVRLGFLWDFSAADHLLRRALERDSDAAVLRVRLADALLRSGQRDAALREIATAAADARLSCALLTEAAWIAYCGKQEGTAIELCHRALTINPSMPHARVILSIAFVQSGLTEDALREVRQVERGSVEAEAATGFIHAVSGKKAGAMKSADRLIAPPVPRYASPYLIARIFGGLGDAAGAETWIQRAIEEGSPWAPYLAFDPAFQSLPTAFLGATAARIQRGFTASSAS
ncbi:MAG TPA: protein kinase [Thermoanaerobaculia bacterium]|nr:protein kinase [Thermoanaerobaculia bacterium]